MTTFKVAAALIVLGLPLAAVTPAAAASAHNSQAGANGDTTNNNAPMMKHMKKHKKHM